MKTYRNIFKEKTEAELQVLYRQYLIFEKEGYIEGKELAGIRDEYLECFESGGNILLMIERDLLHVIADIWFESDRIISLERIDELMDVKNALDHISDPNKIETLNHLTDQEKIQLLNLYVFGNK